MFLNFLSDSAAGVDSSSHCGLTSSTEMRWILIFCYTLAFRHVLMFANLHGFMVLKSRHKINKGRFISGYAISCHLLLNARGQQTQ